MVNRPFPKGPLKLTIKIKTFLHKINTTVNYQQPEKNVTAVASHIDIVKEDCSLRVTKRAHNDEVVMNREFVYNHQVILVMLRFCHAYVADLDQQDRPSAWSRTASTLNRWLWGALCCGVPGVPCYFCTCCERLDDGVMDRDISRVNQGTATTERMVRPHRPHALRGRKHTPETLSAVRCALSQLQGEPAPPPLPEYVRKANETGWIEKI